MAALSVLVGVCSAFMNNVGALALFLPVAIRLARRSGHPPSVLLMPLAFASLLGGKAEELQGADALVSPIWHHGTV